MKKKEFLWLVLALVIFAATGWLGVQTALNAQERMAAVAEQTAGQFASAFVSQAAGLDLPETPYVARLDVDGAIVRDSAATGLASVGGYDHQGLLDYVDALSEDENNLGILLYVDSPGGEMGASDELYLKLMDYKAATGRPIYCYFDQTACSGGYYVAMASDEIWANRNCICVNIGVYISTYNMTGLFEKLGVEQVIFKSSENKGIGMAGVPWTEEQKAIYQSIVDVYYDQFLDVVAQGRGMTQAQVKTRDDGREMIASQALEAGFIDGICRYEEYEARVLEELGGSLYQRPELDNSLSGLLRYFSSAMPRSDSQILTDFAESHKGMVVMAYADSW